MTQEMDLAANPSIMLECLTTELGKMPDEIPCSVCGKPFIKYGMTWILSIAETAIKGPFCFNCKPARGK